MVYVDVGLLFEEEEWKKAEARSGIDKQSEEREACAEWRLRWWESWLHHQAGREMERPVRDRLAHWQRLFWTGRCLVFLVIFTDR